MPEETLEEVAAAARACTVCAPFLPLGARPVFQVSRTARLLIASQAPGTKVHLTGLPFNDASGDRLRGWLGLSREVFYDSSRVAIVPTGFCYPGRLPNGGDAPPRRECAPLWRARLLAGMPDIRLTLLVGSYAIASALGPGPMGAKVAAYRDHLPDVLPLPHPSWRTIGWEKRNPWFTTDLLPEARRRVAEQVSRP